MQDSFTDFVARRFGGVLRSGSHQPDGLACVHEADNCWHGRPWSDAPVDLPDMRPLNDAYPDDTSRTVAMLRLVPVMAEVWADPDWRQRWVERVALETVRQLTVGLSTEADRCVAVTDLAAATQAARAATAAATVAAMATAGAAARAAARVTVLDTAVALWVDCAAATEMKEG